MGEREGTAAGAGELAELWRLAKWCGVRPSYRASDGGVVRAGPESIIAVLRALGVAIDRVSQARGLLAHERDRWAEGLLDPVCVAWMGRPGHVEVRLPGDGQGARIEAGVELEDGGRVELGPAHRVEGTDGAGVSLWRVSLPDALPMGYHRVAVACGGRAAKRLLIVAPERAHPGERMPRAGGGAWGVFAPVHALRSERNWGVGDLGDLARVLDGVGRLGGAVVGVLPILSQFLRDPVLCSPYAPVSRLYFSELFLDVSGERVDSGTLAALRGTGRVDYARVAAEKRRALEGVVERVGRDAASRRGVERMLADDPYLASYAAFRAVGERHGVDWRSWPEAVRERVWRGEVGEGDAAGAVVWYHACVQWLLHRALSELKGTVGSGRAALYLDLPVGVHPDGFDAWRFSRSFVSGVSAGAPPDAMFSGGQDWGFAPLHPERVFEDDGACVVEAIGRHLRYAGLLRIDHVMWMHRTYCVPHGLGAKEGVYVRQFDPAAFYAIASVESHRARAGVAGENLGTVPGVVHRAMSRHGLRPLAVGQLSMAGVRDAGEDDGVPEDAVASINTHDLPMFAAFWRGDDIGARLASGWLSEVEAGELQRERGAFRRRVVTRLGVAVPDADGDEGREDGLADDDPTLADGVAWEVHRRWVGALRASGACLTLVTLEDLWLESRPQNTPGTDGPGNWTRKMALAVDEAFSDPRVVNAVAGEAGEPEG